MANGLRWRSGQTVLVRGKVDSATVIDPGDLVYLDGDDVKPASAFPWTTNLATTQESFAEKFLGVAQEGSAAGSTAPISIDVGSASVYEFACAAGAYELGDDLGPDEASGSLMDQQLEAVSAAGRGIARAVESTGAGATRLRVTLASAYFTGSANANAALG
jgi:hypothetical protein